MIPEPLSLIMGITFTHLLLPVPRSHTPSHAELIRLIGRLVEKEFVLPAGSTKLPRMRYDEGSILNQNAAATGCYIQLGRKAVHVTKERSFSCPPSVQDLAAVAERDFKLVWPVISLGASGLHYPLTLMPQNVDPEDVCYDIEIHWGREYIYRASELIEPFASEQCAACNASLNVPSASALFGNQLYRHCPACGAAFRPEERTALVYNPKDNTTGCPMLGGATSRFALAIECGKCWEYGAVPTKEFLGTCEEAVNCRLEPVLDGAF